jgi:hypothetical protein
MTPIIFYSSFHPGTLCSNQTFPEDLIKISVSPQLFNGSVPCGKIFKLETSISPTVKLVVTSFCQETDINEYINISNGVINNNKCYFNNSINFLFDSGEQYMKKTFNSTMYESLVNFLI